jgi:hypothetical protein
MSTFTKCPNYPSYPVLTYCKGKKRKEMEDERKVIGDDMKIAHITR